MAALRVLKRYLGPLWRQVALLGVLLLSSIGLNLYLPQLLASFLDSAQAHGSLAGLTRLALSYIGIAVAVQLLSAGATYLGASVGWAATNRLRADLTDHLLHLDMSFHKERTPGEMIERIDGDVTALSNFFSQFAVRVFGAVLLLLGALVMFFREQWWVGLMVTTFAAVTLYAMNRTRRIGVEPTRVEREASARLFGFIEERLSGLDDVRALGGGPFTISRFLGVQRNFFWKAYQAWIKRSAVWQLSMLLFAIGYVAVISSAVGLYLGGTITIGTAFLFYQYMSLVEEPIDQLTQQLQDLQKAGASLLRVGELLNLESGLNEGTRTLPAGALEVDVQGMSFQYSDDPTAVLDSVDFRVQAGHTVGLLGRTGSGKTTLTRLVSRLYDPTSGQILLGGVPTTDLELAALRSRIAVVTQDVQLFQATVRDNLTLFNPTIPDTRVRAALAEVGLETWLDSLPDGLQTPLAAGSLSAGESQLLAFARVMLQDPGLIILDEPSSRLDPATESRLTAAMQRLLHGRTAIVIAHRLDTVARADDILVLGAGKVLEYGPRRLLAANPNSEYSRLLRAGQSVLDEVLA
ncbi:ABC transporter ATP-binding protein [Deinococcus ruber]|uniref:ABC transporter ATP-binding protein n=1 Tax=Deinococcus ruber TaxID=1848197 RepID=A0A918F3T8_9DEIO|nr:ABC transporter ATP-binding protein [Deinococcus ruber]